MARLALQPRVWRGASESDRPSLAICVEGDRFFLANGASDEVVRRSDGSKAWRSKHAVRVNSASSVSGGTAGARTMTISVRAPHGGEADEGAEIAGVVELCAQPVAGETVTLTPGAGASRTIGRSGGGAGELTAVKVIKTGAALVCTVACSDSAAETTVDVLVNGDHALSVTLPFTPP